MVGRITANAVFLFLKLAHIVCAIGWSTQKSVIKANFLGYVVGGDCGHNDWGKETALSAFSWWLP